jgi:hypothetical protein
MKSSIKIIKRKRDEDVKESKTSAGEKSVERSRREMVSTVKSWITELQERKSAQAHSLFHLVVTTKAPAHQDT